MNREEDFGDRVKAHSSVSASTTAWEVTPAVVFPVGRGLGSFLLPGKILHFSAGEDGGGLSLMRQAKQCDWAVPSSNAAAADSSASLQSHYYPRHHLSIH